MNIVPILLITALALLIAKEIHHRYTLRQSNKLDQRSEVLQHISRMQEKLQWILTKQKERNPQHIQLSTQGINKYTDGHLALFQRKLAAALLSYPGEADELLEAARASALSAKESKAARTSKYKGLQGKSTGQRATAIKAEDWK